MPRSSFFSTGAAATTVSITARDDSGLAAPGGAVTITLNAGERRLLSSDQLENGVAGSAAVIGRLGDSQVSWIHVGSTGCRGTIGRIDACAIALGNLGLIGPTQARNVFHAGL